MTTIPKFNPKELNIVGELPGFFGPPTPLFDFPCTLRENYIANMEKRPIWQLTTGDTSIFTPQVIPDNIARALAFETTPLDPENYGGKDMFGIEWTYIPIAEGSMVKAGTPLLEDANEWEEKIIWPDVDSWDWTSSAEANRNYLNRDTFIISSLLTGYYERLISFMEFEGAVVAMIDEDQQEAVKALFEKLTDLYIKIVDKLIEHYNVDGFNVHDDWGAQTAPFFSPATVEEMLVPPMKRLTDHIHSKGKYADLHSCGKIEMLVPNMIAAGWDSWNPQLMNDTHMLYEKYGDKIVLGVVPDPLATDATEAEQRAAAAIFVEEFCKPGKPTTINMYDASVLTPAYREELYKLSRIKYSEQ